MATGSANQQDADTRTAATGVPVSDPLSDDARLRPPPLRPRSAPPGRLRRRARRLQASLGGRVHAGDYENVHDYCLFIGHARGGGSLLGALLDAHPNATVADEVDVLDLVDEGYDRSALFWRLGAVSRHQAHRRHGQRASGRSLPNAVGGQSQGRYSKLEVIGTSRAGPTTRSIAADPARLQRLTEIVAPTRMRYLHIVRNPFDAISGMVLRSHRSIESGIETYFSNCDAVDEVLDRRESDEVHLVRYAELMSHPEDVLLGILEFLGLPANPDYVQAALGSLAAPQYERDVVAWPQPLIDEVLDRAPSYAFLADVRYELDRPAR